MYYKQAGVPKSVSKALRLVPRGIKAVRAHESDAVPAAAPAVPAYAPDGTLRGAILDLLRDIKGRALATKRAAARGRMDTAVPVCYNTASHKRR